MQLTYQFYSRVAVTERCNALSRLEFYHVLLDFILVFGDFDDRFRTDLAAQPKLGLLPKQRHHIPINRFPMHLAARWLFHLGSSGLLGPSSLGNDKVRTKREAHRNEPAPR